MVLMVRAARWRPRPLPAWVEPLQDALIECAENAMPLEACGLAYHTGIVEITNVDPEPGRAFTMDPTATKRVLVEKGVTPQAIWHSHPRGTTTPSKADATMAHITRIPLLIATLSGVHYWSVAECDGWLSYESTEVGQPDGDGTGSGPVAAG